MRNPVRECWSSNGILAFVYIDCVGLKLIQATDIRHLDASEVKVLHTEMFDLEGRKIDAAVLKNGIFLTWKTLANGKVITEKRICCNK